MPAPSSFDYAIVRVVPRVEREEFLNAGVIVYCAQQDWLGARVGLDRARAGALWPGLDLALVEEHLAVIPRLCEGGAGAGPIGLLSRRERWHWLVAPRSTVVQVSPVHSGLCDHPGRTLDRLYARMVEPPGAGFSPGRAG